MPAYYCQFCCQAQTFAVTISDKPQTGALDGRLLLLLSKDGMSEPRFQINNAEDMIKKLANPNCNCEVDYGNRAEHYWNGDHSQPNYISRLRYNRMFIPKWAEEVKNVHPKVLTLHRGGIEVSIE